MSVRRGRLNGLEVTRFWSWPARGAACAAIFVGIPVAAANPQASQAPPNEPATAVSTKQDAARGDENLVDDDIVVTAQLREERLKDVPISIVAFGNEELRRRNVRSLDDLSFVAPGVSVQNGGGPERRIIIRGIGNLFGSSSLISTYIDEAPVALPSPANLDLRTYDLERIEVLRGPQGTLYGDGGAGGTIRFITRNPDLTRFGMTADAAVTATEDGDPSGRIEAAVNIPLVTDTLGLRVVGTYDREGGWIDFPETGKRDFNDQNLKNVRAKLLWQPTAAFSVNAMAIVHRNRLSTNAGEDRSGNYRQAFDLPIIPRTKDNYEIYNLLAKYDFGPVELLSATTFLNTDRVLRNWSLVVPFDADQPPFDLLFDPLANRQHRFTQEVRLSSTGAGPLKYTLGGYYQNYRARAYSVGFLEPDVPAFSSASLERSRVWAVFGDVNYQLVERLNVGAGLRYFEDHRRYLSGDDFDTLGRQTGRFHTLSPRFYTNFKLTDDANLYVSAAKGFRSGGFNLLGLPPYGPETVWTYEFGTKLSTADRKLALDVALFYSDYTNIQVVGTVFSNGVPVNGYSNAGAARIKGIEWSASWKPAAGWTFALSGNYLHDRLIKNDPNNSQLANGDRLPLVPDYSFTVSAQRDFSWDGRNGFVRFDYNQVGRSEYRVRFANGLSAPATPFYFSRSSVQNILNFNSRLALNDKLAIGPFVDNILNERGFQDPFSIENNASRHRPRTYGIQLSVNLDGPAGR